jgi:hypothetical protein
MDTSFLLALNKKIAARRNISLTDAENISLVKKYTDLNQPIDIKTILSSTLQVDLKKDLSTENEPAQSASLSSITKFLDITDKHYLQRMLTPITQYKRTYILLDTNNIAEELSSTYKFGWNFMPNALLRSGTVNAIGNIRDLILMRILPIKSNFDTAVIRIGSPYPKIDIVGGSYASALVTLSSTPIPILWQSNRINTNNNFTILIEEFSAQSFVGRDGNKFHFSLFPYVMNYIEYLGISWVPQNPYIEYTTSGKGDGWFKFNKPITSFSTLTITMRNPFDLVAFDKNVRTLIPIEFTYLYDGDETL